MLKSALVVALLVGCCFASWEDDLYLSKRRLPLGLVPPIPLPTVGSGRIVGGSEVNIANFPYILSLRQNGAHICGASVISDNYALSAAHCTFPPPAPAAISLRGGSSDRTTGGVLFQAAEIINHPEYSNSNLDFDVCLIRITTSFVGANIARIALAPEGTDYPAGTRTVVSGWGLTSAISPLPINLMAAEVPLISQESCRSTWGAASVTDNMICASEPGRDACNGDSGGPLTNNGRQIGIVSWGSPLCLGNLPGVYARVAAPGIRGFIRDRTGV
ncbi:trypsin theta [Anopheles darlingi]|uniref:Trypsin theta n=1 Tax=Anopheles darlingi TaxID=43151 RepID=W5J8Y8_ANODA|nr:trypsin 3A1-like [Anopheles darlingi]ETN60426.1 trypsin theta [Anopheles darlingi]